MRMVPLVGAAVVLAGCMNAQPENKVAGYQSEEQLEQAAERPASAQLAPELLGRTARVELADGRIIQVTHNRDGTARLIGSDGLSLTGQWFVAFGKLCFEWPDMPRECWPYPTALRPGETVTSTSDLGQVIRTTLLPHTADPR